MPMGIGLGIGVTRGGGVGWWPAGSELALEFDNQRGFNSIDRTKTTPDSILTYTNPSAKLVYGSDGVLRYAPHNFYTQSADFSSADWAITGRFTASTNATTAPDGSLTADLLTAVSGSSVTRFITQTPEPLSGASRARIYFKPLNGLTQIIFREATGTGAAQGFTCTGSGTVLAGGAGWSDATITYNSSTGWYLCEATHTRNSAFRINFYMVGGGYVSGDPSGYFWSPTGTETAYLWGAHCFRLPCHDTTYIPTTTAAVYSLPIDHNPTTFAPLGVLIEEQRVNLALYSEDFSNAAYLKSNTTVTANQVAAPDGNLTADLITPTLSDSNIRQAFAPASATAHTLSIWLKSATGSSFDTTLRMTRASPFSNVGNTVITVTTTWQRFSFTATPLDTTLHEFWIGGSSTLSTGENFYAFGYQIEAGAFATSYIPTVASQVTRAADQVSILTSAFAYNAAAGTMVVSANPAQVSTSAYPASLDDGASNELIGIRIVSSRWRLYVRDNSVDQSNIDAGSAQASVMVAAAAAWAADDLAISRNGASALTDGTGTLPTVTKLNVGRVSAGDVLNGHIKRLTYFPTRRSNADLQVLST